MRAPTELTRVDVPSDPYASLKTRLDEEHVWHGLYTFKFIMKSELAERFVTILAGHPYTTRKSAEGRHVAITAELFLESSAEVIALYRRAAEFQGVIAL